MTATAAFYPDAGFDFDKPGLLTTLKNLLPRSNTLGSDATISNARRRYTLTFPSGDSIDLAINFDFKQPGWLSDVMQRFSRLVTLETNWDSYGASPVDLEAVIASLEVLFRTMTPRTPVPELVPTPRGTVQLEWHTRGIDLEIDVLSRGLYRMALENINSNEVVEDFITSDLDDISRALSTLSEAS